MWSPGRRAIKSGSIIRSIAKPFAGLMAASVFGILATSIPAAGATAKPADSEFRSGLSAYNGGDYQKAIRIWQPLAEHEDAPSQAGLGFIYHRGLGVPVDHEKAAYWLRKAAEHGQPEGQMLLGSLYFYGQGVPKSYIQAFAWCDLAQDNGNSDAGMCRDSALQYLTSKADLDLAFRASADLHHRLSGH
jgi:TPR repeat protein